MLNNSVQIFRTIENLFLNTFRCSEPLFLKALKIIPLFEALDEKVYM
jgi:hypothetical protein